MQKAFEKIVERLEEEKRSSYIHAYTHGIDDAIEIVNQVAEEYKQEVCEWKQCGGNLRPYQTTSCEKFALHDISYVYCPYCGKRIFVKE